MKDDERPLIVIVIGQLGLGGAERELVTFLREGAKSPFRFRVVSLSAGGEFRSQVELLTKSPVETPTTTGRLGRLVWMRKMLTQLQPALVHSWNLYPMFYLKTAFPRREFPILGFIQQLASEACRQVGSATLFKYVVKAPDGLVSNSQAALDDLIKMGIRLPITKVIHNGVDALFFDADPSEEATAAARDNLATVVSVGRLIARKRHSWMIRTVASLQRQGHGFDLWIIGDGPERDRLRALADELGVSARIRFWGRRLDVAQISKCADIYLHCARAEGLPNAIQEAMAAGLPVVAPSGSGVPEIVEHDRQGLLFEPNDESGCARYVASLITNLDLRERLGRAARFRAERDFRPSAMATSLLAFYRETLDRRKCPPTDRLASRHQT